MNSEIRISTVAGIKRGHLVSREGPRFEFAFDMGTPDFSSKAVPMSIAPIDRVIRHPLRIGGDVLEVTCLSMGNPQCIVFVSDLDEVNLAEIGPLLDTIPSSPIAQTLSSFACSRVTKLRFEYGSEARVIPYHRERARALRRLRRR